MKSDHVDTVKSFTGYFGHDSLHTAFKVLELANQLGLKAVERAGGTYWIAFERDGKPISNYSFFHPRDAMAFLLGVQAATT